MAKVSSKKNKPQVGFYEEPDFVSLTTTLRNISGDDTIPTDAYVDIQKDLYDLITPDVDTTKGGVIDLILSNDKTNLIVCYQDGTKKNIPITEKTLYQAYFDNISYLIYLIFKDGSQLTIDLTELNNKFATKEEVIQIIDKKIDTEVKNVQWMEF